MVIPTVPIPTFRINSADEPFLIDQTHTRKASQVVPCRARSLCSRHRRGEALVITDSSTSRALGYDHLSNGRTLDGGMIPINEKPISKETYG